MVLVYSYKEMPMHKALLLALPLALAACAAQPPPQTTPMRQAQSPAQPQGMMENPVRFVPPEKGRGQTALQRLRDANREASRDVFDGYFTGAKVSFRWRDGEVYNLVLARNRTTTLNLQPGEAYNNAVFGDDRYFGLDPTWAGTKDTRAGTAGPAASQVPVIAWEAGRCTDLTLYTTWRVILLNICANGNSQAYNRIVSWTFPDDEKAMVERGLRQAVPMEAHTGVPVDQLDTRYAFVGPAIFRPNDWTAMNDGRRRTYVIPPRDLGFLPVPAVIGASGQNTPQYEVKPARQGDGSYFEIIADPPPSEIAFQYGEQILTMRRTR
jgi:type IV secretion system protein TrbG